MWIRCTPTLTPSLTHPRTTHRKYKLQLERRPRAAHRRPSPACRAALAAPLAVAAVAGARARDDEAVCPARRRREGATVLDLLRRCVRYAVIGKVSIIASAYLPES